jgi:hypothetical protein
MLGMTRLATDGAFAGIARLGGPGFDDVRRGWLRRSRGVLAGTGELFAQLGILRLESLHLRLQPLAAHTSFVAACFHACYSIPRRTIASNSMNAYLAAYLLAVLNAL